MTSDVQFRPTMQRGRVVAVSVYVSAERSGAEGDVHAVLTPDEAANVFRAYQNGSAGAIREGILMLRDRVAKRWGESIEARDQERDGGDDVLADILDEEAGWVADLLRDLDQLLGRATGS